MNFWKLYVLQNKIFKQTMPLKVLTNEVRARRDLEKFLKNPVVVLDSHHTSL